MRVAALLLALLLPAAAEAASPLAVEGTAMVVSAQRLASEAGATILRSGGNAVDAAVAVGYALAVVHPCCGNLGGGGFAVIRMADGRTAALDFRETAPAAATPDMFVGADGKLRPRASLDGWLAVGVPGTVAGLELARHLFGTLPRVTLVAPALRLAADGFVLTRADTDILAIRTAALANDPAARKIFLHPDGSPLQPGERLLQTDLAGTLAAIAADGSDGFYRGPVAAAIVAGSGGGGGIISQADLSSYRARERVPVGCSYRGLQVIGMPPPSSGGVTLCEGLGILQRTDLAVIGWHGAAAVHVMAEAMRHAFFDRNLYLGDPDSGANPIAWLLSPAHLDAIAAAIGPRATPTTKLAAGTAPHERPETTAYVVVDAAGNAVSVTYTLNGAFGAGVVAPGTGVLMNDEMDDFSTQPGAPNLFGLVQGARNAVAAGRRPLSSMAPTIVLRDGRLAMVLGSPGGSRIITAVLQTISNLVDFAMLPQEAVDAPRWHMQGLPDRLFIEPRALSPDTASALTELGYAVTEQTPWGAVALIATDQAAAPRTAASSGNDAALSGALRPGVLYGALDSRRPSGAAVAP